jgi:citronellol/citronellal dehydrogenase
MHRFLRLLRLAVPSQRLGTESEVSAAICFLLSPAAAFISGAVLRVDGAAPNAKLTSPLWAARPEAADTVSATSRPASPTSSWR